VPSLELDNAVAQHAEAAGVPRTEALERLALLGLLFAQVSKRVYGVDLIEAAARSAEVDGSTFGEALEGAFDQVAAMLPDLRGTAESN